MPHLRILIPLLLLLVAGSCAWGDDVVDHPSWDLGVKIGTTFGTVTTNINGTRAYDYGGFPVEFGVYHGLSQHWTVMAGASLVYDVGNSQVTRSGFEIMGAYHLIGGARTLVRDYGNERVYVVNPQSLSLVARLAYQSFSASTDGGAVTLGGAVIETAAGLEYRRDLNDTSAISGQILETLFSLPASNNRLSVRTTELAFSWRFFI